jgi:hypothetical protein
VNDVDEAVHPDAVTPTDCFENAAVFVPFHDPSSVADFEVIVHPGRIEDVNVAPPDGTVSCSSVELAATRPQVPLLVIVAPSEQPVNVGSLVTVNVADPDGGVCAPNEEPVQLMVTGRPSMVPLNVTSPLLLAVKSVLDGLTVTEASAGPAAIATIVAAPATTSVSFLTVPII